ncbi:hypothetical protein HO133_004501 [Letharia lupina]|uniref:BRCT domain-containing protein n=1 Tax=Letharia lupina TaxID=560253 RepID=A0A8H6KZS1_9LECA|nr:uncharacterized protein HO133_004501 [Letharia lupina]KAF6230162.1 hypothetical protein HO133_004501 [Letharia lupina]
MSSKKCCLRQHIRGEPANLTFIDLSLDDTVLKYVLHGPNLLGSHIEEEFELFEIDTQNGFAFLEALTPDISIESLGRNFDGAFAHTGINVRPSTSGSISTLQLLPGQSFNIGKTTLNLVPEEHSDLPINSSGLPTTNFESYNYQVNRTSTPQRTARVGPAVIETPMPRREHESDKFTPILEQITGQAVSGRKDSKKWPGSPLKREVMRTVRDASENGHSSSQPSIKKEDEHMADAAINEPDPSISQPHVKTEDQPYFDANAARPLDQGVVDLEDAKIASVDLKSEHLENLEPLLSLKSRVHPEGGSNRSPILEESKPISSPVVRVRPAGETRASSHSPLLAGSKSLSSSVARVQPERRPEALARSSILQAALDSSPQLDDNLDDTRARKKTKTATVSREALVDESQDSLQNEVISVKRGVPASTDRPVSADQASSTVLTPSINTGPLSHSANQPKQRPLTPSTGLKHFSPPIDSDSLPHPANQPPSESSFNPTGPNPRTPFSDNNTASASPSNSVEPSSSMRSTRSTARDELNISSSTDAGARICFASSSSAGDSKPFLRFLSQKGVKKVQSVHDCTLLCVGKELKKTSKVILAVLLGKDIITDRWVTDSVKGNDLLSVVPYLARDPEKEADWGISLDEAIYRGKQGLRVLQDQTVLFTPSARKELGKNGFDELKEIVKCAGARSVSSALIKKSPEQNTIVVATHDNTEVAELQRLGWRAYVKDIISLSVLRGKLDLQSDEFLIKEQKKEHGKRKR